MTTEEPLTPATLTGEQAKYRAEKIEKRNADRVQQLAKLGAEVPGALIVNQRLDSLMAVMIPEASQPYVDLHFQNAMEEILTGALEQAREMKRRAEGGKITPAAPSDVKDIVAQAEAAGLQVPGR